VRTRHALLVALVRVMLLGSMREFARVCEQMGVDETGAELAWCEGLGHIAHEQIGEGAE
jgi:hypothetical protein